MDNRVDELESLTLRLASPDVIRGWSSGEVTKPETINYRTQRPERDGLFCEKIFGPTKDYECYCGKYRRIRYKGIVCDKCGVEVTRSIVRRERMAHIELAAPVAHIWFVRSVPSRLGILLGLSVANLERVIYFAGYIITKVDEEARKEASRAIEQELREKEKSVKDKAVLKTAVDKARAELRNIQLHTVLSEVEYHRLSLKYGNVFTAETGAGSLKVIIEGIDLVAMREQVESEIETASVAVRKKLLIRLRLLKSLTKADIRPEWMFLTVLPIIPPDLRPMVALDGGRHASSDANDLYRRVINRNNRLKRLYDLNAPDVITRNEKRMLQEAVDALIDNSMRRSTATPANAQAQRRPLRSLADMLKGKQGRFRQNLLGKRVDYSGRSVIVVGPDLKMHQCGLPKHMALELFRPFVIQKIIAGELAHNIRGANRLIDEASSEVWALLEEVIKGKYVMLNRAPTLHRLGIQAFQPLLIEGNAIKLHPLACTAFNADFDGDQMAVHVPLTDEAQKEARELMASTKNLLKPGTGESISAPSLDIVLGVYWLTGFKEGATGEGRAFSSKNEAVLGHDLGDLDLRAKIRIVNRDDENNVSFLETSVGRILFNAALPKGFAFVNEQLDKRKISVLIGKLFRVYGSEVVPEVLDKVKKIGYDNATRSGISWGMDDLTVPTSKYEHIENAQKEVHVVQGQYEKGLLTEEERYNRVIEIWSVVNKTISESVPEALDKNGSVYSMVTSGARGSWGSINQMTGLKGLMRSPSGRIIELPILSSYKEGFSVFEYFISTHGARKGTADTALKTAVAGYLTRRLVDVSHDVIIATDDCKTTEGIRLVTKDLIDDGVKLSSRVFGRVVLEAVRDPETNDILFRKGHLITPEEAPVFDEKNIQEVVLRSPVYCQLTRGICQQCYGYDLGHNKLVSIGSAVGVVAAQAIGEPGTQLTMRTFHTGGAVGAGADITLGLPRVEEVFETRIPKLPALISNVDGEVLEIIEVENEKVIRVLPALGGKGDKGEAEDYVVPFGRIVTVEEGTKVHPGYRLTDGAVELKDLHRIGGKDETVQYILNEVVRMYALQGASINQKHVEIIVRQMFARMKLTHTSDSVYTEGEIVEKAQFLEDVAEAQKNGTDAPEANEMLMGITKVASTTGSFLSAASFQETSKVLIRAALEGRTDTLRGLKENVIIGRLIPAGTGFRGETEEE